jgi:hypothetical protein
VTVRLGKDGKARHVTLTDQAPELFDRLVAGRSSTDAILKRDDGRPWKRSEQIRSMREACEQAGIVPAVHVLRHTHASIPAMRAVPMAVIARQLGHADTRMNPAGGGRSRSDVYLCFNGEADECSNGRCVAFKVASQIAPKKGRHASTSAPS